MPAQWPYRQRWQYLTPTAWKLRFSITINDSQPLKAQCDEDEECFNFRSGYSCIPYPEGKTFSETAGQRIAILVARLKKNRNKFNYQTWLLSTVDYLESLSKISGPDQEDPQECLNPFEFDMGNDKKLISRAPSVDEWFKKRS